MSAEYVKNGTSIALGSQTLSVTTADSGEIVEDYNMISGILVLLFGIALIAIAQYLRNALYMIAAGVWFIGASASIWLGVLEIPYAVVGGAFFALLGIGVVLHAIAIIVSNKRAAQDID